MAWIEEGAISEDSPAGQAVREHLRRTGRTKPSGILTVFGLLPDLLAARIEFVRAMTFGGSGLGRRKEELIATQVSSLLGCRYWGVEHGEFLRRDGNTAVDEVVKIATGWRRATLDAHEFAILEFAEKLTLTPHLVGRDDLTRLHQVGLTDRQIFASIQAISYRHFISRIADSLGVELDDDSSAAPEILEAFGGGRMEEG